MRGVRRQSRESRGGEAAPIRRHHVAAVSSAAFGTLVCILLVPACLISIRLDPLSPAPDPGRSPYAGWHVPMFPPPLMPRKRGRRSRSTLRCWA